MENYKFQLSFSLPGYLNDISHRFDFDTLSTQGFDINLNQHQVICQCKRPGNSALRTIKDSITHIQDILPEASLQAVSPDLVPYDAVAKVLKLSNVKFKALIASESNAFPKPSPRSEKPAWHLKEVLEWNRDHRLQEINSTIFETSLAAHKLNSLQHRTPTRTQSQGYELPDKYAARSFAAKPVAEPKLYR
ncbi:hypothetical protein [Amphritea balenae]|uniref:DNA-binding protein n=1 Tax=Amphritea balenae TaxID=452629 RepID=A0A3P1SJW3_9GAMM|nr:hypothetical protein [Amphritea balenae]RRC97581.1 hypothetical protein EHS89_17255 [Amphritea balenae]GGK73948.1 hypothetical protein GCM10007941_25000 [Amphritea balenae]